MYRTIQKVVVWKIHSNHATCMTFPANFWGWEFGGKANDCEVIMTLNGWDYLVPIIVFERGFQFMGL